MLVSEPHPGPYQPTRWAVSLACSLMECGLWRAVVRSVLHHPSGQNGRDDSSDLWIIYQRWCLSRRIKNVALAQMTFSHHQVLITQCHEDPPPLLPYLTALMSGHIIKFKPKHYNLEWFQMPCLEHCINWSLDLGEKKNKEFFPLNLSLCLRETDTVKAEMTHFAAQWSHMPFKKKVGQTTWSRAWK